MPGGSLRERLQREGKLSVRDALRIAQEVSTALDYAHRDGFVHRDVKPENILFADGHALLADFGVARVVLRRGRRRSGHRGRPRDRDAGVHEPRAGERRPRHRWPRRHLRARVRRVRDADGRAAVPRRHARDHGPPRHGDAAARARACIPEIPSSVDDAIALAMAKDPAVALRIGVRLRDARCSVESQPRGRAFTGATRNIAVLPFVNASPDPDNEYLSDGITDELIDALAKVEGIRVASRTSVFALKGKPQDVRAIGALLDCPVVLEGTVRRAGNQLRITAQLTSTDDGHLIWSQRYDRQMDDAFAIQDEIARTIVNTLRATSFADLAAPPLRRHTENATRVQPLPQGSLRVEQADAGRRRRRHPVLRAGDRGRSALRARVHGARRLLRAARGLSQRSGRRGIRGGEGVRAQGDRAR